MACAILDPAPNMEFFKSHIAIATIYTVVDEIRLHGSLDSTLMGLSF